MTTIKTLSNQAEAAFLLSLLHDNEFEAVLLDEGSFLYNPMISSIRIQVPDDQAAAALHFLRTSPHVQPGFAPADEEPNDIDHNA